MTEEFLELASLAASTMVSMAATDAWEAGKRGFARLLGRGDPERAQLAERRLEETQDQLASVGDAAEQVQERLQAAWQIRVTDLLEEHPDLAGDLRALVAQIQSKLPAGTVSAASHGVAAGRDISITASGGGVASGTIHGSVSAANPTRPDPAAG
jgi:hypothetical protein